MTARKSELRKYLDSANSLPDDALLGWAVVYQIRDANYEHSVLETAFEDLDMNPGLLPARNNPLHAFQKATMSVHDTDYRLDDERLAHVLVRDQHDDAERIIRQLTREVRDERRGHLGYAKIGECVFYRPKSVGGKVQYGTERIRLTVDHAALAPNERLPLQSVVDRITAAYNRHIDFMDAMKYRAVIRDYLLHLNGLKIKDGFYFVNANRGDELAKLRMLVERIGGGSSMFVLPLVDLDSQRDMVVEAYKAEAERQLAEVVKAVAHVRGTRKSVTAEAYAKIKKQYDVAIQRSNEYGRTLKVAQTTTTAAEELALDALSQLQRDLLRVP